MYGYLLEPANDFQGVFLVHLGAAGVALMVSFGAYILASSLILYGPNPRWHCPRNARERFFPEGPNAALSREGDLLVLSRGGRPVKVILQGFVAIGWGRLLRDAGVEEAGQKGGESSGKKAVARTDRQEAALLQLPWVLFVLPTVELMTSQPLSIQLERNVAAVAALAVCAAGIVIAWLPGRPMAATA